MPPWNGAKAKVQLRLAVQRLKTLQEKKEAQAKLARRDVATLLERNKLETSRIKVESLINDDIYLELLELMELYCELLIARFGMLDQPGREPDPSVAEAVGAVVFAAQRTELKELHILRELLMGKYGRDYSTAVMENVDGRVSERVSKKLAANLITPSPELVDAYLAEIAKGYSIPWAPATEASPSEPMAAGAEDLTQPPGESSSNTEAEKTPATAPSAPPPAEDDPPIDEFDLLKKRFDALKKR